MKSSRDCFGYRAFVVEVGGNGQAALRKALGEQTRARRREPDGRERVGALEDGARRIKSDESSFVEHEHAIGQLGKVVHGRP